MCSSDLTDDALVQSGLVNADQDAVITIPGVKVYAKGSKITLYPSTTTGVSPDQAARLHPHVALSRNPVQGKASLTVEWPTQDDATIDVYDLQGRHVRNEFRGLASGITEHTFRSQGLPPGVYLVNARQGKVQSTRRITVLD